MTTVPSVPASSLRVERPNTAGLATRLAYPALSPVRWGLNTAVTLGGLSPVRLKWVFAVTSYTDGYGAPLRPQPGTRRASVDVASRFRGEWLWRESSSAAKQTRDAAILYLHGGGFCLCGLNTHRRLAARIGRAAGLPVFQIAYRQLPQAHITDTVEDCVAAYRHLLDEGFAADRIVLAGDSAGGGLSFLVALACRDRGLPMPAGIAALSPWGDLDDDARAAHPNAAARRDTYVPTRALGLISNWGFAVAGRLEPAWQPAKCDLTGLPPVLIQVGSTEILLSDAERLGQRCAEAGVPCTLQIWDRAPHVFQAAADLLPEGRSAIREVGRFARRAIVRPTPTRLRPAS